jgi:hypothetical protein
MMQAVGELGGTSKLRVLYDRLAFSGRASLLPHLTRMLKPLVSSFPQECRDVLVELPAQFGQFLPP